jgi:hypothetical protein
MPHNVARFRAMPQLPLPILPASKRDTPLIAVSRCGVCEGTPVAARWVRPTLRADGRDSESAACAVRRAAAYSPV